MSETAQATRFGAREWAIARPWLAARWFPLGVAAITLAAAAFLFHQLLAWPPHEDETLPLFIGRHPLDQMFQVVLEERGGAPLHFLLAWTVAHLGLGLEGLRAVSAFFAVASLPVVALLLARLGGRVSALIGTLLVATSWTFLFHGVYGRMYSLFLFTARALVSRAAGRAGTRRPARLGALGAGDPRHRRDPSLRGARARIAGGVRRGGAPRPAAPGGLGVRRRRACVGIPFWLTDLVLAGRFDAGVAAGSRSDVVEYVWQAAGDFTAGFPVLPAVLVAAAAGLAVLPRETRILRGVRVGRSARGARRRAQHRVARDTAPDLPAPVRRARGRRRDRAARPRLGHRRTRRARGRAARLDVGPDAGAVRVGAGRPPARPGRTRPRTSRRRSQSDDVLLGYDPLFLQAWELNSDVPPVVLPRADADLALHTLLSLERPLGHGIWVLDASKTTNIDRSLQIPRVSPRPESAFEVRDFGPFLVIRTREPVVTPKRYLERAGQAMLVGKRLYLGDADINLPTIERAARALRGYGASRSLSTSSR